MWAIITGTQTSEIILLLIQYVFCTHLIYSCQYSKDMAMCRPKTPWCPKKPHCELSPPSLSCGSTIFSVSLKCCVMCNDGSYVSNHLPFEKQGAKVPVLTALSIVFVPLSTVAMVLHFCDSLNVCPWFCLDVPKGQGLTLILLNTIFSTMNIVAKGAKGLDIRCLLPRDCIHSCDHVYRAEDRRTEIRQATIWWILTLQWQTTQFHCQ